jgi:hypothetical protein
MTDSIKDHLIAIHDALADLPKAPGDLAQYTDSDIEMVQNLKTDIDTLHGRLITPRVIVAAHPEIVAEAVKLAYRERN